MNHIETMKLALEALEGVRIEYDFHGNPLYDEDKKIDPASTALRQAIAQAENNTRYSDIQLAEMILSDCGVSSENTLLLNRVAARIEKHVDRALEQDADEWFEKALWGEPDVYGDGNVYRGQRSKDSETKTLHYTEPLRSSWFKLTDEEVIEWVESGEYNVITNDWASHIEFAKAIEAKLKEKNK